MMNKINVNNIEEELKGICVVEISGESCANCLSLMPVLYELCSNRDDCRLIHIEATEDTVELMNHFNIEAVPTLLIVKDGKEYARCKGYQPEEILELWLDAKINELK